MNNSLEKDLQEQEFLIRPVSGDSMLPMLDQNQDTVKLVAVKEKLKKYDLPLYRRPNGQLVLHRIIKVTKSYYLTCGDNRWKTEKIPFAWVIAVTEGFWKNGKYISCTDPTYLHYAKKRSRNRWLRKAKSLYQRLFRFLKAEKPLSASPNIPPEWKYLVLLLRSAVLNEPFLAKGEKLNWQALLELADHHKITALLFPVLKQTNCPAEILDKWRKKASQALRKDLLYEAERTKIFQALEQKQIRYLPLKGILIKDYYPQKGMREFADHDILYDKSQQKEVQKIMLAQGYQTISSGMIHDQYHKEPIYNFELHKELFAEDQAPYFAMIWEKALPESEDSCRYSMTQEDFYVYFLAHFKKHFQKAGAGLRYFTDLWYLQKNLLSKLDFKHNYLNKCLQETKLKEFNTQMLDISERIFGDQLQEIPLETFVYLMQSGAYGIETHLIQNNLQHQNRLSYFRSRLFPSLYHMKVLYPFLTNLPFLLPLTWLGRWFNVLTTSTIKARIKRELKSVLKFKK